MNLSTLLLMTLCGTIQGETDVPSCDGQLITLTADVEEGSKIKWFVVPETVEVIELDRVVKIAKPASPADISVFLIEVVESGDIKFHQTTVHVGKPSTLRNRVTSQMRKSDWPTADRKAVAIILANMSERLRAGTLSPVQVYHAFSDSRFDPLKSSMDVIKKIMRDTLTDSEILDPKKFATAIDTAADHLRNADGKKVTVLPTKRVTVPPKEAAADLLRRLRETKANRVQPSPAQTVHDAPNIYIPPPEPMVIHSSPIETVYVTPRIYSPPQVPSYEVTPKFTPRIYQPPVRFNTATRISHPNCVGNI